jgi:hypothetical protein
LSFAEVKENSDFVNEMEEYLMLLSKNFLELSIFA